MMKNKERLEAKYLIGNSAGGIGVAESIQEVDKSGRILDSKRLFWQARWYRYFFGEKVLIDVN
jgi:hypothetical protein